MFLAAFTSRSCAIPHVAQVHSLTTSCLGPSGPLCAHIANTLASVSFADDFHASAALLALVQQLRPGAAPTGVQHGLCHACACQLQAAHIAYDYPLVTLHHGGRIFVQGIRPTAGYLAMDPPCVLPVRPTLGPRTTLCVVLGSATGFKALPVRRWSAIASWIACMRRSTCTIRA